MIFVKIEVPMLWDLNLDNVCNHFAIFAILGQNFLLGWTNIKYFVVSNFVRID